MTPEALAALHAAAFADRLPQPWSAASFAAMLSDPAILCLATDDALAVGRLIGPEAELLTLAVAPAAQGAGRGQAMLAALEAALAARGAGTVFLEVAATNARALGLYARSGYRRAGCRPDYYAAGVDALILNKSLAAPPPPAGAA